MGSGMGSQGTSGQQAFIFCVCVALHFYAPPA